MPFAQRDGCRIYWRMDGASEKPPLLLLNSIGTDMSLWERCLPHLLPTFCVIRMDTRGHGASDAPDGDYTMAELADDALAVLDAAGVGSASVAGVSLGGMIAMELALTAPGRVDALALICTSAAMDRSIWVERVEKVRAEGTAAIADVARSRFLSPRFARQNPLVEQSLRRGLLALPAAGYAGAGAAIRDMNLAERLPQIGARTLVVGGDRDISTPFAEHGRLIAEAIPSAEVAHLDVGHLAPVEAPAELAATLRRFILRSPAVEAAEDTLFNAGLANRRHVLGDAWVDQSLANQTEFNADFQAMITRVAWHEVWGRPGLDDRTRRLLVLAITAALGRWEEFRLHVRAGLEQGGFTQAELKEVLMQCAIYAGLPAANTGFGEAAEVLNSLDSPAE